MKTTRATRATQCRHKESRTFFHAVALTMAVVLLHLSVAQAHPSETDMTAGAPPCLMPPPGPGYPPFAMPASNAPIAPLRSVEYLPAQAQEVKLETPRFYFHDGLFFTRIDERYVVVPAPQGAIIATLPAGFTTLHINGAPLYFIAGVYYRPHAQGYMVIASPVDPAPQLLPPPPMPCTPAVDSVTMTVHLAAGDTAPVVLKRHGRGWLGPKGEMYDRLPSEQQLAPYYR